MAINEQKLEQALVALMSGDEWEAEEALEAVREARSYEDAGILTRERGLVIRAADGWEFQVTIHVSRRGVEKVNCPSCGAEFDDDGDEIGEDGKCIRCRTDDGEGDEEEGAANEGDAAEETDSPFHAVFHAEEARAGLPDVWVATCANCGAEFDEAGQVGANGLCTNCAASYARDANN